MFQRRRRFRSLFLLPALWFSAQGAFAIPKNPQNPDGHLTPVVNRTPTPTVNLCGYGGCYDAKMSLYDQTNPNFALVTVPSSIFRAETQVNPAPTPSVYPVGSTLGCGSATFVNPYYTSWLPLGPMSMGATQDPGAVGLGTGCGWWLTAICGPTSESMALMAAIRQKSPSTTVGASSWTRKFSNGVAPPDQVGISPNPMVVTSPSRSNMTPQDVQRVINMAVLQGTNPDSGGNMDAYLQTATDFSPHAATTTTGTIDAPAFTHLIQTGWVVVACIHDYAVSLSGPSSHPTATLTFVPSGHILAVNGTWKGSVLFYDPVYAVRQWVDPVPLANRTYTQGGKSLTLQLPSGLSSAAVWSKVSGAGVTAAGNVNSVWDLSGGTTVTLIDGFNAMKVQ